jgi:transposase
LERGIAVRQGFRFLRSELPGILARRSDVLSPRMVHLIEDLAGDWRGLDERIERLSADIEDVVAQDAACERLMTVPGIGPIISSRSRRWLSVNCNRRSRSVCVSSWIR